MTATADGMIGRPAGCGGDHGWSLAGIDLDSERHAVALIVTKNERAARRRRSSFSIAPAILAIGRGGYSVLYMVAGLCAIIGAFAILPVRRVR
jgi:hypothetical protein